jgi:hypothetical protein
VNTKAKILMTTLLVLLAACSKTKNRRSTASSAAPSKQDNAINEPPSGLDPEKEFQTFLASLATASPTNFKEKLAQELLKIQLTNVRQTKLEKGRCFIVSTKEPFPAELKAAVKDKLDFVDKAPYFIAVSKAKTLESPDCVSFFKASLGFRFETHFLSQHVAFFSFNI